mmetsp:Transcript_13408/g.27270  ORF Transcript_13408/g.27270 Transcript_13408/m.27270 type:complete len:261 (+) Transcript_13408:385-1167(+)
MRDSLGDPLTIFEDREELLGNRILQNVFRIFRFRANNVDRCDLGGDEIRLINGLLRKVVCYPCASVDGDGRRNTSALHLNVRRVDYLARCYRIFKHNVELVTRVNRDGVALALHLQEALLALVNINCVLRVRDLNRKVILALLIFHRPLLALKGTDSWFGGNRRSRYRGLHHWCSDHLRYLLIHRSTRRLLQPRADPILSQGIDTGKQSRGSILARRHFRSRRCRWRWWRRRRRWRWPSHSALLRKEKTLPETKILPILQ